MAWRRFALEYGSSIDAPYFLRRSSYFRKEYAFSSADCSWHHRSLVAHYLGRDYRLLSEASHRRTAVCYRRRAGIGRYRSIPAVRSYELLFSRYLDVVAPTGRYTDVGRRWSKRRRLHALH